MKILFLCDPCNSPELCLELVKKTAVALGCQIAIETTLKSKPGSIHLHIKRPGQKGTLEYTAAPTSKQAWLAVHENRNAPWIAEAIAALTGCGCRKP